MQHLGSCHQEPLYASSPSVSGCDPSYANGNRCRTKTTSPDHSQGKKNLTRHIQTNLLYQLEAHSERKRTPQIDRKTAHPGQVFDQKKVSREDRAPDSLLLADQILELSLTQRELTPVGVYKELLFVLCHSFFRVVTLKPSGNYKSCVGVGREKFRRPQPNPYGRLYPPSILVEVILTPATGDRPSLVEGELHWLRARRVFDWMETCIYT
ncbi:hypothetical protein AMTR_s00311p00010360 [Amborella trichopoda]|uniref:Uncharacterized protein n=1 Tax=Amborella trichopoda TaxID=13333 RepID=U5D8A9_AMBTC|nr:hypothetical protein AMTR_s00311p00010360 [Amborella trichopoda]